MHSWPCAFGILTPTPRRYVRLNGADLNFDDNIVLMTFQVDMGAVADALGYGNVKSAGNRFSALKKKYDIRIETTYARSDVSTES